MTLLKGYLRIRKPKTICVIIPADELRKHFFSFSGFDAEAPIGSYTRLEDIFPFIDELIDVSPGEIREECGRFIFPGRLISFPSLFQPGLDLFSLEPSFGLVPRCFKRLLSPTDAFKFLPRGTCKEPLRLAYSRTREYRFRKLGDKWVADISVTHNNRKLRIFLYNGVRRAFFGTGKDKSGDNVSVLLLGFNNLQRIKQLIEEEIGRVNFVEIPFEEVFNKLVDLQEEQGGVIIKESHLKLSDDRSSLRNLRPPLIPYTNLDVFLDQIPFVSDAKVLYNYLSPIINALLSQHGYYRLRPSAPISEQVLEAEKIRRDLASMKNLREKEIEDVKSSLRGVLGAGGRKVNDALLDAIANAVVNLIYPVLYVINPQFIDDLNPRSGVVLALRLNDIFYRWRGGLSSEEAANFASQAAAKILRDSTLHQGFTSAEIGDIAKYALRHGLIRLDSANTFTTDLGKVTRLLSPIRDELRMQGVPFSVSAAVQMAADFLQKHPTMSLEEASTEIRRSLELKRRGGEYESLTLIPEANRYIRYSGVPIQELAKQHEELKENAINSPFGAGLGAVAKVVRSGYVSKNSPAWRLYEHARSGQPIPFVHPHQFYEVLVASGISPDAATYMLSTPEESKYWLTPELVNSLRATQFHGDWGLRFKAVESMFPGKDKNSQLMRDAMLSYLVGQAGYKNIHHFLALHGDVLKHLPSIREQAKQYGKVQEQLAGADNVAWGGVARVVAELQDIGEGRREEKLNWKDLLKAIQFHEIKEDPYKTIPPIEMGIPEDTVQVSSNPHLSADGVHSIKWLSS